MGFDPTVWLLPSFLPSLLYTSEILYHIPVTKTVLATKSLHKTSVLCMGEMADSIQNCCNLKGQLAFRVKARDYTYLWCDCNSFGPNNVSAELLSVLGQEE